MKALPRLSPGRILGKNYEVVEFLGNGWEGEVYKIEERSTGIPRAAKIFYDRPRVSDSSLRRYARKMFKLRSCDIVTQYHHRDTVRMSGKSVDVMISDFVEGIMLSTFLGQQRGKRLSSFEALHVLYAVVSGIEQIHALGEYHGDIHSDNIMINRQGIGFEIHLLDFFDLGRPSRQKVQADVYDLVSLLYEMIGDKAGYTRTGSEIRQIVLGRKHTLIRERFRTSGDLRSALENLNW
ncbi:MAG: protein kinase [candidate division Zixibacteria bacterium]|nr:protein kinase [candidate division Zixibacteria bacterium]MBU1471415.1 protein kinase [candidate division Zixibacteria bacterium]MBU2626812.1 protein kinase [candidate division Zixibacteria bacterium]